MKKAVIASGGKQYLVSEGQTLEIDLISNAGKSINLSPLLVIDGDKVTIGTPNLKDVSVNADIIEAEIKADKVTSIRYKAKKRVHKLRGHRQSHSLIKIKAIK